MEVTISGAEHNRPAAVRILIAASRIPGHNQAVSNSYVGDSVMVEIGNSGSRRRATTGGKDVDFPMTHRILSAE